MAPDSSGRGPCPETMVTDTVAMVAASTRFLYTVVPPANVDLSLGSDQVKSSKSAVSSRTIRCALASLGPGGGDVKAEKAEGQSLEFRGFRRRLHQNRHIEVGVLPQRQE